MMKSSGLILFVIAMLPCLAQAQTPSSSPESTAITAMMQYCIQPVSAGNNVEGVADVAGMVAMPADQAAMYNKRGGRAYSVPGAGDNVILLTYGALPGCSMMVRRIDNNAFWAAADDVFRPGTGFEPVQEEKTEDMLTQHYTTALGGQSNLVIAARMQPAGPGVQLIMTFVKTAPQQ